MLITFLLYGLKFLVWLFVPKAVPDPLPVIDPNLQCKGCGHTGGSIQAVLVKQGQTELTAIRKTCDTCGATYDYLPVYAAPAGSTFVLGPAAESMHEPLRSLANYGTKPRG